MRPKKTGKALLWKRTPMAGNLALIFVVLFCVAGVYALYTHTLAASSTTPQISSGEAGQCLDDYRNSQANHASVVLWHCDGSAGEQFTVSGALIRIHGLCLDTLDGGKSNGTKVQLYACDGRTNQKWSFTNNRLVNANSNACLDAHTPGVPDGTQLQTWHCNNNVQQIWKLTSYTITAPTPVPTATATATPTATPPPTLSAVKGFDADVTANQAWFNDMASDGFKVYLFDSVSWNSECANGSCSKPATACTIWGSAQQQIQYALNAGFKIGIYNRNPECWHNGIAGLGKYVADVKFYVLDIETDPGIQPTTAMVNGVKAFGITPIIYSGAGMWPAIMGNSTAFASLPLQDTEVTGDVTYGNWAPSLINPAPQSYGGWNIRDSTSPTGYKNLRVATQQSFNTQLFGQSVDLDSFNEKWIDGL